MLDLRFIRDNLEVVRQAIINRQDSPALLDDILQLDGERRRKMAELEEQRRVHKVASKQRQLDEASMEEGRKRREQIRHWKTS
jgi:seryl-tRNA synthetase